LMNRTWNLATTTEMPARYGTNSIPPVIIDTLKFDEYNETVQTWNNAGLGTFVNLSYDSDDAMKIEGMGTCNKFRIDYYDPYTLQLISSAEDMTSLFNDVLKLKDHPVLNWSRPYVLFKVERIDDCVGGIFGMQEETVDQDNQEYRGNSDTHTENSSLIVSSVASNQGLSTCSISPNPTSSIVKISCSLPYSKVELWDSVGNLVTVFSTEQNLFDFSLFSSGSYLLRITFENEVEIYKLIRL